MCSTCISSVGVRERQISWRASNGCAFEFWEQNIGPLWEHQVLLTTALSIQPLCYLSLHMLLGTFQTVSVLVSVLLL